MTDINQLEKLLREGRDLVMEGMREVDRLEKENKTLRETIGKLEFVLLDAPNPYSDTLQISKYKSWWLTDRLKYIRASSVMEREKRDKKKG